MHSVTMKNFVLCHFLRMTPCETLTVHLLSNRHEGRLRRELLANSAIEPDVASVTPN